MEETPALQDRERPDASVLRARLKARAEGWPSSGRVSQLVLARVEPMLTRCNNPSVSV